MKELESKHFLLEEDLAILSSINVKLKDLIGRQLSKIKKVPLKKQYSPALRSFALRLIIFRQMRIHMSGKLSTYAYRIRELFLNGMNVSMVKPDLQLKLLTY